MNFDLTEEQRMWKKIVHDFVAAEVQPKAREVDETGQPNWEAIRKMGPVGLLGLSVPEAYGGAGVDAVSAVIALEEIGWACGSTALTLAAHNGLGTAPIGLFGSEELKKKWLPLVTSGKGKLAALALTEPGAGSDIQGGVTTRAEKSGNEWMINGTAPSAASCATPTDKIMALGQKLSVHGTPTIFLANGERIPGAIPADIFEAALINLIAQKKL